MAKKTKYNQAYYLANREKLLDRMEARRRALGVGSRVQKRKLKDLVIDLPVIQRWLTQADWYAK